MHLRWSIPSVAIIMLFWNKGRWYCQYCSVFILEQPSWTIVAKLSLILFPVVSKADLLPDSLVTELRTVDFRPCREHHQGLLFPKIFKKLEIYQTNFIKTVSWLYYQKKSAFEDAFLQRKLNGFVKQCLERYIKIAQTWPKYHKFCTTTECIGVLYLLKAQFWAYKTSDSTTILLTVQNWQITS